MSPNRCQSISTLFHYLPSLPADLSTAEITREGAVIRKTQDDQDRAWRQWVEHCHSIGITTDFYLDFLEKPDRIKIVGASPLHFEKDAFLDRLMKPWLN
jgi:hypothetical protein